MNQMIIPVFIPRGEAPKCPKCHKIEDIKEVCKHCQYEYPEDNDNRWVAWFSLICLIGGVASCIWPWLFKPNDFDTGIFDYIIQFILGVIVTAGAIGLLIGIIWIFKNLLSKKK